MTQMRFEDAFIDVTKKYDKVRSREVVERGEYVVIDQSESDIAGYVSGDFNSADLGPVVIFGDHTRKVKFYDKPFIIGAEGTKVFKTIPELDESFAYHWLKSQNIPNLGYSRHSKVLKDLYIDIPSIDEQRRIAGILDAASAGVAGAEIILDRIEQAPVEVFRRLFHNFPSIPLGSVAQLKSGSTPSKDRGELWDGDFPWFTAKDFKSSTLAGSLDRIAPPEVSAPRVPAAPAGSVLCVVRGMILAHTFPVSKILVEGSFNQDVKWLRVDQREVLADFLLWGLRSKASWVLDRAETSAHGTKRIPTNVLLEVSIPRASISEQDEFKMIIQKISEVKERAREVLKRRRELFSALQYRAFRGEL